MRDQGRIHGPSSDPVEYMKRRFREYDRKFDDLYRRGERVPGPTRTELPTCSEGFRYGFDHTEATAGSSNVVFDTFDGSWASWNVYINYSSVTMSDTLIHLPAGIWVIGATWRMVPAAAPTSGTAGVSIYNNGSPPGFVNVLKEESLSELQDFYNESGNQYDTATTVNYIGEDDDIYLSFGHSTDVSVRCVGEIFGVQVAGCNVTVDDS